MLYRLLLFVLLAISATVVGQNIDGVVMHSVDKYPIAYVNVGIVGKNVGTVTDLEGNFRFMVDAIYDNDTIMFSIIGYKPVILKVADLRNNKQKAVLLEEKIFEIAEVVVKPKFFKQRTLGETTKFKKMAAGFKDNLLGYECGILMKSKKSAFIKKVNINISSCTYDTIFYRLNIYSVQGKMNFMNILNEPIYITVPRESAMNGIQIDLESKNIVVAGDFLVTLEHVKNLGNGHLYFCAGLKHKTYFRKTSQGKWETVPIGVSISVVADVEK